MPADLGGQAPVGGDASVAPTSSRLTNGPTYSAFAGELLVHLDAFCRVCS